MSAWREDRSVGRKIWELLGGSAVEPHLRGAADAAQAYLWAAYSVLPVGALTDVHSALFRGAPEKLFEVESPAFRRQLLRAAATVRALTLRDPLAKELAETAARARSLFGQSAHLADRLVPLAYRPGPTVRLPGPLTPRGVLRLCRDLRAALPGHEFGPEDARGGGVIWYDWPGRRPGEYKSVQLGCEGERRVYRGAFAEADYDKPMGPRLALRVRACTLHLRLYAHYGAPPFSPREIKVFVACLKKAAGTEPRA